jgi:F-type H+-transporting ATPase subunit epsilon
MPIRVEIVSQDRMVYQGDADMVIVPGVEGEMGILPNHAPLLSTLKFGILKVRAQGTEEVFAVSGGLVEVQPDIVTVLANAAENVEEIDISRAEEAKRRAEEMLEAPLPPESSAYLAMEAALKRSNLRLEAAHRYRRRHRATPGSGT